LGRPAILFLLLFLGTLSAVAQQVPQKGVPYLQNFTPPDYNNQGKVWDIDSAPNGIVYMAADKGLLEYDGKNWNSFSGSAGNTRSVYVESDSLIYTGSDLDFGVWEKNRFQKFEYQSLYPFRDDLIDLNEEFWEIHKSGENIIFVSDFNVYVYRDENLTKIAAPSRFKNSFTSDSTIYFEDENSGVYVLQDLTLNPLFELPDNPEFNIAGIYEQDEDFTLITENSGIYRYSSGGFSAVNSPLSQTLRGANVFSFEKADQNLLAVGTIQQGLYIADLDGNILHYINRNKGLPNNTILSLHSARNGKLWTGMDFGISSIDLKSNVTYFYDYRGGFGTGYAATLNDDVFYLGTNTGLFRVDWDELNNNGDLYEFDIIPESDGQVWAIEEIEEDLFIGHDDGLFILDEGRLNPLNGDQGYWTIIPYGEYILGGTYNGVTVFEKSGDSWTFLKQLDEIRGSANQLLVQGENILWVNIPNYGIIRAELDEELNPEDIKIFQMEEFEGNNAYMQLDDEFRVLTDRFVYSYSETDSSFTRGSRRQSLPAIQNIVSGINQPVMLNEDFDFVPVYNGFALRNSRIDVEDYNNDQLVLREIEAYNNEESYSVPINEKIPFAFSNLNLDFLIPNEDRVQYQYKLDPGGYWSAWSDESEIQLVNIDYGSKELKVNARIDGEEITSTSFSFEIAAPWYRSWYAYIFYGFLLLGSIYLLYLWQRATLRKQEKQMLQNKQLTLREQAEKHRQKIMEIEKERLQDEYDQLEKQLKSKTIELANKAKENQDKNRLLVDLKKKIKKIQQETDSNNPRWSEIHNLLESYINQEDNTFEIQMDELHQEFYQNLKESHPDLSTNDLRLCAYLKLGFNSKEIADFLNIQPSSVYISRSRLRKKLDLDSEQDLHDFLNKY